MQEYLVIRKTLTTPPHQITTPNINPPHQIATPNINPPHQIATPNINPPHQIATPNINPNISRQELLATMVQKQKQEPDVYPHPPPNNEVNIIRWCLLC
jgi:hypothetical protein